MGGDRRGSVAVAVLLAGVVLASMAVVPVDGLSCGDTGVAESFERGDGSWVFPSGGGFVTRTTGGSWLDGGVVDLEWPDDSDIGNGSLVSAFARGPDGGWVVVYENRAVRLDENWSAIGGWQALADGRYYVDDIAYADGRWWTLRDGALEVYSEDFSGFERYEIHDGTRGMTAAKGSLWTIRRDGTVTRFDVDEGRPVVSARRVAVGRELQNPEDLDLGPDGDWWVLSEGGGIAGYSPAWEHTGYRYGDVWDTIDCGPVDPPLPPWQFVAVHLLVVGAGVHGSFRTHSETRTRLARVAIGVASLGVADTLFNYRHPELFSWLYRLPDVAVTAPLVCVVLLASTVTVLYWDDRTVFDAVLLFALTSPLFFAGLLY